MWDMFSPTNFAFTLLLLVKFVYDCVLELVFGEMSLSRTSLGEELLTFIPAFCESRVGLGTVLRMMGVSTVPYTMHVKRMSLRKGSSLHNKVYLEIYV